MPVADAPARPVRLDGLLDELGFPTSQALKKWLMRRELPCWRDGGDLWTDRTALDAYFAHVRSAVESRVAAPRPKATPGAEDIVGTVQRMKGR